MCGSHNCRALERCEPETLHLIINSFNSTPSLCFYFCKCCGSAGLMSELGRSLIESFSYKKIFHEFPSVLQQVPINKSTRTDGRHATNELYAEHEATLAGTRLCLPVDTCPLVLLNKFLFDGPLDRNFYHSPAPATVEWREYFQIKCSRELFIIH